MVGEQRLGGLITAAPTWRTGIGRKDPLESLRLVASRLFGASSQHRIATVVAEAAVEVLGGETVVVGTWDELGWQVRVLHERGLSTAARRRLDAALRTLEASGRPGGAALAAAAEALVADAAWPHECGALAALMPPPDRPVGIVLVGRAHGGPFAREQRRFLDTLAAVSALALGRVGSSKDRPVAGSHVHLADMHIHLADQEVVLGDRHVHLTPSELRILLFLAGEPGHARTRQEILRHVWHTDHVGDERACDAHISNLRRKIERDPSRPSRVVTVRSVGYALRLPRNGA